ncbi:hypothetical protein ETJ91_25535 [Bacillus albus]|nr:hypothetical protein ETJ91_25535 [Bacillus albus]RXJ22712.1 hypothetical protein ETJ90_27265 [Bacillus albus]RXJ24886.1 hypothetical protein ETJ76_24930 [Bacillus albus]RXJ36423.1 hypothetical protein ETJ89_26005 [Bacillus albus]RXJ52005.1 hypothetical protein ETJ66_26040 [Bacillus albus]
MAMPNPNSSPTYRWAKPFIRLRKENSFGEYVKKGVKSILWLRTFLFNLDFCLSPLICSFLSVYCI